MVVEINEAVNEFIGLLECGNLLSVDIPSDKKTRWLLGLIACVEGLLGLVIWGVLFMLNPVASNQLSESSMIIMLPFVPYKNGGNLFRFLLATRTIPQEGRYVYDFFGCGNGGCFGQT